MRYLRSFLAVLLGYIIFVVAAVALFRLSGREPHAQQPTWFMLTATLSGVLSAGIAGAVATVIAPGNRVGHAVALAILIAIGAAVSLLKSPPTDATWSMWSALALMAPGAYIGGRLWQSRSSD